MSKITKNASLNPTRTNFERSSDAALSSEKHPRVQLVDFPRSLARAQAQIALAGLAALDVVCAAVVSACFALAEVGTDLEKKELLV
jgi:hypothetical protein